MERIKQLFKRKPLIVYATAFDPNFQESLSNFRLILKFADAVEIGMPFSDPLADGPTIQKAHVRALSAGASTEGVLELVSDLRQDVKDKPIILMGYYNPIFVYGEKKFLKDAKDAGADGIIIPDLPPEEGENLSKIAKDVGIDPVFLAAPTSTDDRLRLIGRVSGSFIYYVSLTGTTGAREELDYRRINLDIERVRNATFKKVIVGFGISKKKHILNLPSADGYVVGSAVVKKIEAADKEGLEKLLSELREAVEQINSLEA